MRSSQCTILPPTRTPVFEMLLELALWLGQDIRGFNVFGYITLRTVLAAMTAMTISLLAGPAVIRWLAAKKIGQAVRDDGPKTHLTKAGTPTMGGALILIAIAVTVLLWGDLRNLYVWITLLVTLGFGAVGWIDDWRKVVYRDPKGLPSRLKYLWTSGIAFAAALLLGLSGDTPAHTDLIVPFFKDVVVPLGVLGFIALSYFVINGTSHAVNLTDGLDGLAIMPTVMVAGAAMFFISRTEMPLDASLIGFALALGLCASSSSATSADPDSAMVPTSCP